MTGRRDPSSSRRPLWSYAVYIAGAATVVGVRGLWLADLTGCSYRAGTFARDFAGLLGLLLVLRLVDFGLRLSLRRALPGESLPRRLARGTAYALAVVFVFTPFILATLQLHPQRLSSALTPADLGLDFEEVRIPARGRELAAWVIPSHPDAGPITLLVHGASSNKSQLLPVAASLREKGLTSVLLDLPGHGESPGWTSTFGALERHDVTAARDWIASRWPARGVAAVGYSMGAAAVLGAAADGAEFERIVSDSGFARARSVADASILWPFGPLADAIWQLGSTWALVWSGADLDALRPEEDIARLHDTPILLVHGTDDRVIPSVESTRLKAAATGPCELWSVPAAGHVEAIARPTYGRRVAGFLLGR